MAKYSLSEFADKMNEVMPVLIQEFARRQANELYKGKITLPQFLILDLLSKKGESKMSELAQLMAVTTAAITGIADRIIRYGYALRVYDPADRRIIRIKLTSKGVTLVRKINQQRHKMIIDIFGRISAHEREEYLSILMRIRSILAQGLIQNEAQ